MCGCLSHGPPTGDLACNPGMCPDWESNRRPFGSQPELNPLSHTSQGNKCLFLIQNTGGRESRPARRRFCSLQPLETQEDLCLFALPVLKVFPLFLCLQSRVMCPGFSTGSPVSGKPLSAGRTGCSLLYFHPDWVTCNAVLILTTQSDRRTPQVKGSFFYKTVCPHFTHQLQVGSLGHLNF